MILQRPQTKNIQIGNRGTQVSQGGAATLGLRTNLTAWWALDEASGNALDSHTNGLTLTDVNTVTSAVGVGGVGLARQFTRANAEFFSRADETLLRPGNADWAMCAFVYPDTLGASRIVASKDDIGTDRNWILNWESATGLTFRQPIATTLTISEGTTGAWLFLMWWYVLADNKIYMSVNNGTVSNSTLGGSPASGSAPFSIGGRPNGGNNQVWDGRIAKVGYWKGYIPTAAQVTGLYNGGVGVSYAQL